jgi:hypothetical protein
MSWQVKEQFIDKALSQHYIKLHDPDSGAEHHLIIHIGPDSCPLCGHVTPKTNLGEIEPQALIKVEIENLEKAKAAAKNYALKHGRLPVVRADGKAR